MGAAFTILGFEVTVPVLVLGAIVGMAYGLLAVGLVLVYRSNRIINFAHGEVGSFAAAVFGVVVLRWHVPYWVMFPVAMTLGAATSMLAEIAVIRRLRHAPKLMSIVVTLGVGQFLQVFSLVINSQATAGSVFPQPAFIPEFGVGALNVTPAYSGMLFLTPVLVAVIAVFLRRHRVGKAMRGAAANADAARMAGISAGRMSSLAWGIAGAVSAFTAILFLPTQGFVSAGTFGPSLLLRALVAAVVARMQSLPIALATGVGLGVAEQLLLWNHPQGGLVEAAMFVVILVALLVQRSVGTSREQEKGSWASVLPWPPLPDAIARVRAVRALPRWITAVGLAIALALVMEVDVPLGVATLHWGVGNSSAVTLTSLVAFAIVGLSIGIITGLGGQLTLGQFAIAGVGATSSYYVTLHTGNFLLAFVVAGLAAGTASLLVGVPALRIRGLMLTVTTLSFGLVVPVWLLQQSWMLGSGVTPGRPSIAGHDLGSGKAYYVFALFWLVVAYWLARNIRGGGLGRRLVAVRDNEDNARAFTVNAAAVKLQAFALSGFVAGIGGAVYGHSLSRLGGTAFPLGASVDAVVMAVMGGIGLLSGPVIGAVYVIGVPAFLPLDSAGVAATKLGALLLILYAPGGLAQLVRPLRERLVRRLARRAGVDIEAADSRAPQATTRSSRAITVRDPRLHVTQPAAVSMLAGDSILVADGLMKYYGGVQAVDGVSLTVRSREILGMIGPNGAGKTTLFELLGGFNTPDAGTVSYFGRDITGLGAERRAQLGLIRSFQDAALFPTLTVIDTIQLAFERAEPTRLAPALMGLQAAERRKQSATRDLIGAMGLDQYRDKQIRELSTGTRRITELACLVALQPTVLLLDEPASGIAQRETEALGAVLRQLRDDLDLTMVVIEHDIPLIMGLADRIVAMDTGRVIAEGSPEQVRHDPGVIESYLGGDPTAIHRSTSTAVADTLEAGGPD